MRITPLSLLSSPKNHPSYTNHLIPSTLRPNNCSAAKHYQSRADLNSETKATHSSPKVVGSLPLVERHSRRRPHTSSRPFSLHQTSQKCTHTGTKKMCRWPSCGRGRTIQFLALRAACKIGRGSRKCEGSLGWATYPRRQTHWCVLHEREC